MFSLTPSTSTRKKGKQFTLERNRATVTKVAHSAPEQNFHVNQLSQEEIRFSHDASENLSKLFDNELWQRQSWKLYLSCTQIDFLNWLFVILYTWPLPLMKCKFIPCARHTMHQSGSNWSLLYQLQHSLHCSTQDTRKEKKLYTIRFLCNKLLISIMQLQVVMISDATWSCMLEYCVHLHQVMHIIKNR